MKTPRALVPVLLTAGLALAACGGSSSGGTPSAAASKASAIASAVSSAAAAASSEASNSSGAGASSSGGGAATASDKAFCDTFSSAKDRFGSSQGLPTKDDIQKIKQFADDLEKTAPAEQKANAKVLADYFRFIADAASHPDNVASTDASVAAAIQKISPAIASLSVWAATHCSSS